MAGLVGTAASTKAPTMRTPITDEANESFGGESSSEDGHDAEALV